MHSDQYRGTLMVINEVSIFDRENKETSCMFCFYKTESIKSQKLMNFAADFQLFRQEEGSWIALVLQIPNHRHVLLWFRGWGGWWRSRWHQAEGQEPFPTMTASKGMWIFSCVVGRERQKHTFIPPFVTLDDSLRKSPAKIWLNLTSCVWKAKKTQRQ